MKGERILKKLFGDGKQVFEGDKRGGLQNIMDSLDSG